MQYLGRLQFRCAALLEFLGLLPRSTGLLLGWLAIVQPSLAFAEAHRVAIATEHELTTRAALSVLQQGGNAVDAAVAAALVSGVVSPASSGLGGGGFALVWLAKEQAAHFLDFRERAPLGLPPNSLDARPLPEQSRGLLVGAPGEPTGLYELQRAFGRLEFSRMTVEAARLARQGFAAGPHLVRVSHYASTTTAKTQILQALGLKRRDLGPHTRLRAPELAVTLERFGAHGPTALLVGDVARDWILTTRDEVGVLGLADLRDYRPKYREPLRVRYGRFVVITSPPPSAGGILLAQALGTFLPEDWGRERSTEERIHLLAAAYRASFTDRFRHLGDPDFVPADMVGLLDPQRLTERRQQIASGTHQPDSVELPPEHGTTHISIVDAEGNAVALTTTINNAFGAKILAPESGTLLNDELDDFGPSGSANQPRPGARPVSSMTPTIVLENGRVRWVLGGSGGMAISTNVTTALLAMMVEGASPERAVNGPRFTIVPRSGTIELESGFAPGVLAALVQRGERVRRTEPGISAVQAIACDDDHCRAAADHRKHGLALTATLAIPVSVVPVNARPR